jgi:hypothetical protein
MGVVLLGLPHVISTPTLLRASSLAHLTASQECQLLVSGGSSSSLKQSSLEFVPPAFPLCIETISMQTHCLPTRERGRGLSGATVYLVRFRRRPQRQVTRYAKLYTILALLTAEITNKTPIYAKVDRMNQ